MGGSSIAPMQMGFGQLMGVPETGGPAKDQPMGAQIGISNYKEARPPISYVHVLQKDSKIIFKIDFKT